MQQLLFYFCALLVTLDFRKKHILSNLKPSYLNARLLLITNLSFVALVFYR